MLGVWNGFYKYKNEKMQEIFGFEKTNFKITITDFDGTNFSGEVQDDVLTGGMKGTGKIIGKILGEKITFEKLMPNMYVLNSKGEMKKINKRHPTIYYSGLISENKQEITGNWYFKRKLVFLFGFFPIFIRPESGIWKMNIENKNLS